MDSMKNRQKPQAIATPSICPCSVLNCSRPNSDQYRLGMGVVLFASNVDPRLVKRFGDLPDNQTTAVIRIPMIAKVIKAAQVHPLRLLIA